MSDFVKLDRLESGILRLVMNQPGKKNAMNAAMRTELREQVEAAAVDRETKAVILTGADGEFSAGGDIQGLMAVDKANFRHNLKAGHKVVESFWELEKPLISAIEGVGVGGGLALAMCADHIVMSETARIGFTFMKIGFVPDWGTPFTVAKRVGPGVARRLFQSCDTLDAQEAWRIGLVDEIVPAATVQHRAVDAAKKLAARPPRAFAYTKRLMQSLPNNLDAALEMEVMVQENCFKNEEFMAGVERFIR